MIKIKIPVIFVLILFTGVMLTGCISSPDSGSLDKSFNSPDGFVLFSHEANDKDRGVEVAVQPDGKIVALGYCNTGSSEDLMLVRYNSNGSIDTSFGNGGFICYDGGNGDRGLGLALQQDGKIVAVGYIYAPGGHRDVLVLRYNTDGTLDTSFGTGGVATYCSSSSGTDIGFGVAIQEDGGIIVVGETANEGNQDALVIRLTPAGSLDSQFGTGGVFTYGHTEMKMDRAFATAIQADGKIVVVGASVVNSKDDVLVFRLNPNGTLDSTFGNSGVVLYSGEGDNTDYGNWVVLQPDGKIVVNGAISDGSAFDMLVLRYNPDGSPDNSFGNHGAAIHQEVGDISDYSYALVIQKDGKLVVCGYSNNGANDDLHVVRFEPNGTIDRTFGKDGMINWNGSADKTDFGQGMALQPDGKLVIVGFSQNAGDDDLIIMRLNP